MDYRQMDVWQKSMRLVKVVYPLSARLPAIERFALADQIRRAVTSIALNIAEAVIGARIGSFGISFLSPGVRRLRWRRSFIFALSLGISLSRMRWMHWLCVMM